MKVYILTDLEGVGGVVNRSQVFAGESGYEKSREWLTLEVNAAVAGALEGGATEVVVLDGHGANGAVNMLYDRLHEGAQYIQGSPWGRYLPVIDETFGAFFHIGAHAMSGTGQAILEHTMSSTSWVEMLINGRPAGEIGLCAYVAGHYGVPFAMVSGDDKACAESAAISPGLECATVKYALSRHCALLLPQSAVHGLIREKACIAVTRAGEIAPTRIDAPVEIQIEYFRTEHADGIREREGVRKIGPRTVVYSGADIVEAFGRTMGG